MALLTSPTLARTGFAGIPELMRTESPDIVNVKEPWSRFAGLYANHLLDNYAPVQVDDALFFVRNDLTVDNTNLKQVDCAISTADGVVVRSEPGHRLRPRQATLLRLYRNTLATDHIKH